MREAGDARPAPKQAVYLLDKDGYVVGWPSRCGTGVERHRKDRHLSMFYTPEACARGEPERDMRLARGGGLETTAWRLRDDGTRHWARVLMTALEDDAEQPFGFVLLTGDATDAAQPNGAHLSLPVKFDRRRR
jgi:hypothetical protein